MALIREFIARSLVLIAVAAFAVTIGTWWASLLVVRAAGNLDVVTQHDAIASIGSQLDRLAPGTTRLPQVESAIRSALEDPAVTQALATSVPNGSALLSRDLSQLDHGLAPLVGGNRLTLDVGQHGLASLARRLRSTSKGALVAFCVLSVVALVLSPIRHRVLRHLGFSVGLMSAAVLVVTWGLPSLIGHSGHSGAGRVAQSILSAGDPVRMVVLECLAGGVVVYVATHIFAIVGGPRLSNSGTSVPLAKGRVV